MTEREKRIAIIVTVIIVIILLWLFLRKKGRTFINQYDDANMPDLDFDNPDISIGDVLLPYMGVNSCGCTGHGGVTLVMPTPPAPVVNNIVQYRSIQQSTPRYAPARAGSFSFVSTPPPSGYDRADASGRYSDGSLSRFFGFGYGGI